MKNILRITLISISSFFLFCCFETNAKYAIEKTHILPSENGADTLRVWGHLDTSTYLDMDEIVKLGIDGINKKYQGDTVSFRNLRLIGSATMPWKEYKNSCYTNFAFRQDTIYQRLIKFQKRKEFHSEEAKTENNAIRKLAFESPVIIFHYVDSMATQFKQELCLFPTDSLGCSPKDSDCLYNKKSFALTGQIIEAEASNAYNIQVIPLGLRYK